MKAARFRPALALANVGFFGAWTATLFSCPPEVVRPAGDETGVEWRRAAGTEVGFRLGAREPVFQLDPGPLEHPRLCHGRSSGPEHASQTSPTGVPRRRRAE